MGYVNDKQKIHRVYTNFLFSILVDKENWGTGHKVQEGVGQTVHMVLVAHPSSLTQKMQPTFKIVK